MGESDTPTHGANRPRYRERVLSLIPRVHLTRWQRLVLTAIAELADPRGMVFLGDVRLFEEGVQRVESRAVRAGARFRGYLSLPRLKRTIGDLCQLSIVRRWWRLSPSRRWTRILHVREDVLAWCADGFPRLYGRPWNQNRDGVPWSVRGDGDRPYCSPLIRRMMRGALRRAYQTTPESWRQAYGRGAIGHIL